LATDPNLMAVGAVVMNHELQRLAMLLIDHRVTEKISRRNQNMDTCIMQAMHWLSFQSNCGNQRSVIGAAVENRQTN
jgi:hypothetical protein